MNGDVLIGRSVTHATFVIERSYDASPRRVFKAWANVEARARWGVPSPGVGLEFLESDFRVGGRDISRCGPLGNLIYRVETRYADIVPDERIVFTETVADGATRLSIALLTMELESEGPRTRLTLTTQIAALDGTDMVAGNKSGWGAALDNLALELHRERASA